MSEHSNANRPDLVETAGKSPAGDSRASAPPSSRQRRISSLTLRFVLIVLLANLLVFFFGYKFVASNLEEINFAEKEQAGIAYLPYAWPIYQASLAGRTPTPDRLAELADAGVRYDEILGTAFYRQRFVEASLVGGGEAIDAGRSFIARIADNANLSVDPDLNTLRAVQIVAMDLPDIAHSALVLFTELGSIASESERIAALDRFERANDLLTESLGATDALNFNTQLTARLSATQSALNRATRQFLTAAADVPIGANQESLDILAAAHDQFQLALSEFWASAAEALDVLLANRLAYLNGQLWTELEVAAGIYLAVMLLIWGTARSFRRRSRSLMRVVNRMRNGDLEHPVPHTGHHDEIGDLARAVDVFRTGLLEKRLADEAIQRQNQTLMAQQSELGTQNVRFDAALNNMRHGLAMFDEERRLVVWNRRFAEIYGLPESLLATGTSYDKISDFVAGRTRLAEGSVTRADALAGKDGSQFMLEFEDGRILFVSHAAMPDGGLVTTHEDITDRRRAEAQVTYMAFHDTLTMLPNRALFKDRLNEALSQSQPDRFTAILYVDLDNFKSVNDVLGHPVGDALLKLVSERLLASVDEGVLVARLASDEFAVILGDLAERKAAGTLAAKIVNELGKPYLVDTNEISTGASIGIALAPDHGADADILLKNADMALYRAKTDGRGTYRFFEPEMDAELQTRRLLEMDLRQALAHDELELYYQPLIDIETDRINGFEALLRWHHPSRGTVQPNDFIPLAEDTGLIVPIGEWVLRRACAEAATWPEDVKVAVNLSATQFKNGNLVGSILGALSASQIRPARLELEITESLLLQESEETLKTLHQLRSLGVRIAMDDFGTGYSSLNYLRSFPFDKIKVDKSFVQDLSDKEESLTIIRAVIGLGRGLGIRTTAEGVETPYQLRILSDMGYSEVQGMLFSAPRPGSEVPKMLGKAGWRRIAVA
jgi:diguanylate cyclase (GGDEF)-like protein